MNFSREKNIIEIKEEYKRENESSYWYTTDWIEISKIFVFLFFILIFLLLFSTVIVFNYNPELIFSSINKILSSLFLFLSWLALSFFLLKDFRKTAEKEKRIVTLK
jgi:hypothetical protein